MRERIAIIVAVLLVTAAAVTGAARGQTAGDIAYVTRAVDGNAIYAAVGERMEAIRYIGVAVPFIDHPTRGPEPYAGVVLELNRRLVEGKWIRLRFDQQARDDHGRLLAYVWVDGLFVNAALIDRGYAEAERAAVNTHYAAYFQSLEANARRARRGMWGYSDVLAYHRPRPAEATGAAATGGGGRVFSAPNPIIPSSVSTTSSSPAPAGAVTPGGRSSSGSGSRPTLPSSGRPQPGTTYPVPGMR